MQGRLVKQGNKWIGIAPGNIVVDNGYRNRYQAYQGLEEFNKAQRTAKMEYLGEQSELKVEQDKARAIKQAEVDELKSQIASRKKYKKKRGS